jgi:2-polyprenyl-3-methyl-5-hydroxy-6-metoxy-1,4-benzoquinol methylase
MTLKTLDLGCGARKTDGADGLDIAALTGVDIVHDLTKFPYPIADNSYERIVLRHVIEHIPDSIALMREIHRIGKPGCIVEIYTPHFTSINSYSDPTHLHHFALQTFDYFCGETAHAYTLGVRFDMVEKNLTFWPLHDKLGWVPYHTFGIRWFAKNHPVFFERFFAYWFPINEISAKIRVVK